MRLPLALAAALLLLLACGAAADCPEGQFEGDDTQCHNCSDGADGGVWGCAKCAFLPGQIVATCTECEPVGYALDTVGGYCTQCGPNIKACTAADGDVALECKDGYTLDPLTSKCNGNADTCKVTVPFCTRCGDDADSFAVCQECAPGHTLGYDDAGLDECKPCQEGCSLCQYDAPGVCLPDSCFDGFAYVTALSVCAPCHATCASCHWDPSLPDGTICDDCKSLNAHFSGEDPGVCVENDPPPPCTVVNCDLCVAGEPGKCATCHSTFLKQEDGTCACPEGKADGGSGECLAVPGGCNVELCARCADGRPDLCEECTTGYVTWGNPLGTSCNVIRPIPCDVYGCYTCLEGDKNQCTLTGCAPGFTLTPEGQCHMDGCALEHCVSCRLDEESAMVTPQACDWCSPPYHINPADGSCSLAPPPTCAEVSPHCATCDDEYRCIECEEGFVDNGDGDCWPDERSCTDRDANCGECDRRDKCKRCKHGSWVVGATGVCRPGQCSELFPGCRACSADKRSCKACSRDYRREGGKCLRSKSRVGKTLPQPKTTKPPRCKVPRCKACSPKSASSCAKCARGYKARRGKCVRA